MTHWIVFQRLPNNDLPLPNYQTEYSAAIDFSVCLKRPCLKPISQLGEKCRFQPFYAVNDQRQYSERRISVDDIEQPCGLPEANYELEMSPGETILVSTGYKTEFKEDHVLLIYVRSSTGIHGIEMANGTAVIDSDYRGELYLPLYNRRSYTRIVHGLRICQGILMPIEHATITEKEVSQTARGSNCFGSTGTQ